MSVTWEDTQRGDGRDPFDRTEAEQRLTKYGTPNGVLQAVKANESAGMSASNTSADLRRGKNIGGSTDGPGTSSFAWQCQRCYIMSGLVAPEFGGEPPRCCGGEEMTKVRIVVPNAPFSS